jgi:hypothetical protein
MVSYLSTSARFYIRDRANEAVNVSSYTSPAASQLK